jgi:uncharacterized protein
MKEKAQDPRRLDVVRLAVAGETVTGELGPSALQRLTADAPLTGDEPVHWAATGEQRRPLGAAPQTWLHLSARATVTLTCQRCLQPLTEALKVDRWLRFVADEAQAERLDEESEEDVLALPSLGLVDLPALVEDELILALPIVPRHETCPQPLTVPAEVEPVRTRPFEALAALKRTKPGDGGDA